jgi:thiamine-phosphate pyrophosphorylase
LADDLAWLQRTARTLSRTAPQRKPGIYRRPAIALPGLILVTDPARTPEPAALAAGLPRGCGVIYRSFGESEAGDTARRLARVAKARGLVLLIGADALRVAGAGAHLPERLAHRAGAIKRARPGVLVTAAAHSLAAALKARRYGADAVLLSTVFESRSPSAGRPLGPVRFAALVRKAGLPVYALGGVTRQNAPRLKGSGAAGLAMVEGLVRVLAQPGRRGL